MHGHEHLDTLTAGAAAGNRAVTAQALTRTQDFATALAEAGHMVTATLAYGVDSTAHRAAAQAGRATLAVLPRGLDRAHPHNHAQLLSSIPACGGAVVSLFPPGTETSEATLRASTAPLAGLVRAMILSRPWTAPKSPLTYTGPCSSRRPPATCAPTATSVCSPSSARLGPQPRARARRPELTCTTALLCPAVRPGTGPAADESEPSEWTLDTLAAAVRPAYRDPPLGRAPR